jgi:hypothetical protein
MPAGFTPCTSSRGAASFVQGVMCRHDRVSNIFSFVLDRARRRSVCRVCHVLGTKSFSVVGVLAYCCQQHVGKLGMYQCCAACIRCLAYMQNLSCIYRIVLRHTLAPTRKPTFMTDTWYRHCRQGASSCDQSCKPNTFLADAEVQPAARALTGQTVPGTLAAEELIVYRSVSGSNVAVLICSCISRRLGRVRGIASRTIPRC